MKLINSTVIATSLSNLLILYQVPMSSSPDKTDTPTYIDTADTSRSSTDSLSGSVEQSVKVCL